MCGEPAFSSNGHQRSQAILTAAQGGAVPVSSSSSRSQYGGDGGGGGGGGGGVGRLSQLVVVVMPRCDTSKTQKDRRRVPWPPSFGVRVLRETLAMPGPRPRGSGMFRLLLE